MTRFARFIDALHESRQREADRIVGRHQMLIDEARDYERQRASAPTQAKAANAAPHPAMHLAARSAT